MVCPPPVGTFNALACVLDEARAVVWLDKSMRSAVHTCHVVTEATWALFHFQDNTLDPDATTGRSLGDPRHEWQVSVARILSWDSERAGPSPSTPQHLRPWSHDIGNGFSELRTDAGRRIIMRLAQPAMDWWPEQFSRDAQVTPNPARRRIDYGALALFT